MKKTLLVTALLLAAVSPAMAARKKAPAPVASEPAVSQRIGILGEYTSYDYDGGDMTTAGAGLQYSRDIYTTKNGTVLTLRVSGVYSTGDMDVIDTVEVIQTVEMMGYLVDMSREETVEATADITSWNLSVGVDANYKINEQFTFFVGPRLGYGKFEAEEYIDASVTTYGVTVGVRYQLKDSKVSIEAGASHIWNSWDEEETDTSTSNSVYVGVHYAF